MLDLDEECAREKLIKHLRAVVAPHIRSTPIADNTELYYDLGIYGDDMFEFVVWARKEFGIEYPLELKRYAPGEMFLLFRRRTLRLDRMRRPYESFTVRHVLDATRVGRWSPF